MQHSCLHLHEYSAQFTCLECPNCVSVFLHLVNIISQILLVVINLDRNMHRHMAWCLLSLLEQPSHLLLQHCSDGGAVLLGELEALLC